MKKRLWGILAVFALLLGLCFSMNVLAEYPAVSGSAPLKAYGWQSREYTVFSDQFLTEKIGTVSYQECDIIAIEGNAAQIQYREEQEVKEGWISLKKLVYNPEYKHQVSFAGAAFPIYKRPTVKAGYVTVPQFSGGVTVSQRGSWMEVIFKVGNQYYMGWMPKSSWQGMVRLSMETTTQVLKNGTYTISPRNSTSRALTFDKGTGKFSVTANKNRQSQKFTLRYVSGGYYLITPLNASGNLADENGLTLKEDNSQMWKLSRTGGCFYIRSKNSMRSLRYASGKVSAKTFQKAKTQQWKFVKVPETPTKENSVVFSQYDPKWGGSTYYDGPTRRTISTSGCGVVSLTNAVYALNGEFINPALIARFSVNRGHYFYNQGTADTLYKDFAGKYGKKYHFRHSGKTFSLSTVRRYLKNGSVAIALVPGHYIAIVGYRGSDGRFLILDSAVTGKRPTNIDGDWVSASDLRRGTLWCEYFHILSKR